MSQSIVTKESLITMLSGTPHYVEHVVGRALMVIFYNQTADEASSNDTKEQNGIGFTGADARGGSITAKYYIKHQRLEDWMVDNWTRRNSNGVPRLAKYHKQLDIAAKLRAV